MYNEPLAKFGMKPKVKFDLSFKLSASLSTKYTLNKYLNINEVFILPKKFLQHFTW